MTAPAGEPYPSHRFGDVALALALITPAQLEAGLRKQADLRTSGAKSRLGETFMLLKVLDLEQVKQVLSEQRKRRQAEADRKLPAERFGEYQLVERLGEGGMGAVYKSHDVLTGRVVALKVLRKGLGLDKQFVARFDREIKAAERLEHPHIVATLGCGILKGIQYLAMEFIDGENLYQRIQKVGALPETEVVRIALGIAKGLEHAHRQGLVHRDVKPENVLLGQDGSVKLADLGLAKSVYGDSHLTQTGEVVGTPYYLSPEQAMGIREIDGRADLYALGGTLYHALTGRVPFDAPKALDILMLQIKEQPVPLTVLNPALSPGLVRVVEKLMAKDREQRYPSAHVLVEDLEHLARGEGPVHAHLQPEFSTGKGAASGSAQAPAPITASRGQGCFSAMLWAGLVGALACWLG